MQGVDAYKENSDKLSLEQFVMEHKGLVKKIALNILRKLPSHIDLDDLLQAGFVGLLEARNHFKYDMGSTFDTYASIRIRGSILDSLRRNSWGTKESIKNMRMIGDAITRIEQRNQKQPSSEEVAAELGISMEDHLKICQQISISHVVSMDALDNEANIVDDECETPSEMVEKENIIKLIKSMLTTLPEREQMVLSLYYIEEFTFKQIGEILNLTEARICQLHSQAISKLQSKLNAL